MSLLFKIQNYLRRTGMPETKFGRLAVNDPRLVGDLRRGRSPGTRVSTRVERFIMTGQRADLGSVGRPVTRAGLPLPAPRVGAGR